MTIKSMVKCCNNLTPTENQLAHYILQHKEEIETITIQKLAEITFVSKSVIHRFCKKIGLAGFNELKIKLAQDLLREKNIEDKIDVNFPFSPHDHQRTIAQKLLYLYKTTIIDTHNFIDIEELNKVVTILHSAKVIDIYTHAHNINIAENFQDKMLSIGRIVNCEESFYKQRCRATASDKNHVAIILSYSGLATFIPQIVKTLHKNGVEIILIGRAGINVMSNYIKHRLYISDRENLRNRISHFSSHIAMQYILDLIFSCIFTMDYEKNLNYIEKMIDIIDDRIIEDEK